MKEAAIALHPPGLPLAKNIPPAQTSSTQTIDSTLQRRKTLHTFGDNLIELFNFTQPCHFPEVFGRYL